MGSAPHTRRGASITCPPMNPPPPVTTTRRGRSNSNVKAVCLHIAGHHFPDKVLKATCGTQPMSARALGIRLEVIHLGRTKNADRPPRSRPGPRFTTAKRRRGSRVRNTQCRFRSPGRAARHGPASFASPARSRGHV